MPQNKLIADSITYAFALLSSTARHSPCDIGSFPHTLSLLFLSPAVRPYQPSRLQRRARGQYLGPAPLHSPLKVKARSSFVSIERHADARSAPPDYSTL